MLKEKFVILELNLRNYQMERNIYCLAIIHICIIVNQQVMARTIKGNDPCNCYLHDQHDFNAMKAIYRLELAQDV